MNTQNYKINVDAGMAVPSLLTNRTRFGQVTQGRIKRMLGFYAVLFITGLVLSHAMNAADIGLSLMIPGGGLLHYASGEFSMIALHLLFFVLVQFLFLIGLALWIATGNVIAPIFVWIASGVWAALMEHPGHFHGDGWAAWLVPLAVIVGFVALRLHHKRKGEQEAAKRDTLNQSMQGVVTAHTPLDENGLPKVRELTPDEIAFSRYFYDRALQPVDGFDGFDKLDQFREAAFRYQIFYLSNALSMKAMTCTPAMRAYHDEAQDNLMQKMVLHPVWSYWQIENIWGNLNWDDNPLPDDNVMYTGWYAAALGMYISNSGTDKYNAPGSLKLRNKKGEVAYTTSFPELCETLFKNFQRSDYTLFACEPKFIYPICSGFGATALKIHDRLYGSQYWAEIQAQYRDNLEKEFIAVDGRVTAIRCYRTGMSVPGLTSAMADAAASFYLNGYLPDIARRSWEVARNSLLTFVDGKPVLEKSAWDKIDFGNYRRVPAATHGLFAMAAREMGDDEIAETILKDVDNTVENTISNGVKHYKNVSVGGHAVLFGAALGRVNALHDGVAVGMPDEWINGPMLEKASYPEVQVAKAVNDGKALHLVMYPGTDKRMVDIEISQLTPNGSYQLEGISTETVQANSEGCLPLSIQLDGRSELHIKPRA